MTVDSSCIEKNEKITSYKASNTSTRSILKVQYCIKFMYDIPTPYHTYVIMNSNDFLGYRHKYLRVRTYSLLTFPYSTYVCTVCSLSFVRNVHVLKPTELSLPCDILKHSKRLPELDLSGSRSFSQNPLFRRAPSEGQCAGAPPGISGCWRCCFEVQQEKAHQLSRMKRSNTMSSGH